MSAFSVSKPTLSPVYHRSAQATKTLDRQPFNQHYLDHLAQGDPDTSCHFVQYFTKLLVAKLRAKFRSGNQAEDAAQETLLRVLRHLREKGGIDHPERLGAFVHSVCDNVMLEFFRSGSRFQQIPENAPEPVSQAIDAEFNCITEENKEFIKTALRRLRDGDRIILQKVFLLEQDKDEICRELGIDRNYLRVQVHRALARLRSNFCDSKTKKATAN